jgi:hypothetical protein
MHRASDRGNESKMNYIAIGEADLDLPNTVAGTASFSERGWYLGVGVPVQPGSTLL